MKSKPKQRHGGRWLLAMAREISALVQRDRVGNLPRPRRLDDRWDTSTAGWAATIGDLGKGQPLLEIFYCRFAGHKDRKLWAGFSSYPRDKISRMVRGLPEHLFAVREFTEADVGHGKFAALKRRLDPALFCQPVVEHFGDWGEHFFGFYDPTTAVTERDFCRRAAAFFLDVTSHLEPAASEEPARDIYVNEDRKLVAAHLRRERSHLLPLECKIRDKYRCLICGETFAENYGDELGADFAEAHHTRALRDLPDKVKTRVEDLITVCANCHRMLHRMEGKPGDVEKLKKIVQKHRRH